jgi:hypothetical protein
VGAYVGYHFQWRDVDSPESAILDLRFTKVGTLWNDQKSRLAAGKLRVDGFVYDQIDDEAPPNAEAQLGWLNRQPKEPKGQFLSQPYEQLAAVLGKMGLEEDARKVMIAKNEEHGRHLLTPIWDWHRPLALGRIFEWCWYKAIGKIIAYGYRPWNAFVLSLIAIGIGWLVFERGYHWNLVTPTGDKSICCSKRWNAAFKDGRPKVLEAYPKFNAFVYSLETFVPLLKLQVSQYWIPNANRGGTPLV